MMRSSLTLTALAAWLAAGGAIAGPKGDAYAFTTSGDGDDVRVVISGEGDKNVLVLKGDDAEGTHTLRMSSSDGLMTIESEPDPDRPWLGVLISKKDEGLEVSSVMEGSPAHRAGLQAGDLIVEVDGRDLRAKDSGGLLENKGPGDRVRFRVLRDGSEQTLRVRLDSHPGRVEFPVEDEMGPFGIAGSVVEGLGSLRKLEALQGLSMLPLFDCEGEEPCLPTILQFARPSKPRLGVKLESLSDQLAGFFQVPEGKGMLITEVTADSVAQRAGLKAGDVLVQIDDTEIASLADIRSALKDVGKGEAVSVEVVRRGLRESFTAELDTEPNEQAPSAFSVGPAFDLRFEGEQGALRWLRENGGSYSEEVMEGLRAAAAEARVAAGEVSKETLRATEAEVRRSVEEALARTREASSYSEAERTF